MKTKDRFRKLRNETGMHMKNRAPGALQVTEPLTGLLVKGIMSLATAQESAQQLQN
jgi:hypothetical protein